MKINHDLNISREKFIKDSFSFNQNKSEFREILSSSSIKITYDQLQSYLVKIDEAGERLRKSRSFQDLARYKQLVKQLIQTAVDSGLALEKHPSQNRLFLLVETINGKLMELTDEVLYKERDNLRILALIGEIKGLLINLYI